MLQVTDPPIVALLVLPLPELRWSGRQRNFLPVPQQTLQVQHNQPHMPTHTHPSIETTLCNVQFHPTLTNNTIHPLYKLIISAALLTQPLYC